MPTSAVDVRLRRKERARTDLEVVHERLDAATGCPVRYTVHLAQRGARPVSLKGDDLPVASRRFVHLMERNAGADAEVAFLLVSDLPGVTVEEIVCGQIGPLQFAGVDAPPVIAEALAAVPGGFVLHLPLDRAGVAVAEDRNRDPFRGLYREALGPDARATVEARRDALGYRVAKERRLICTPALEGPLRAALLRAGHNLVVRSR